MAEKINILDELHWLMDVLQSIDVGLVVLNQDFEIELWNSFMQNHSALMPSDVMGKSLFSLFPELPENWFRRKAESVFVLHNAAFTTWEQRQYLIKFKNYRPITGVAEYMYQNSTIVPLIDTQGDVNHICLIIYDVTDTAVNKEGMRNANAQLEQLSRTDRLTQLFNRGWWEECLEKEFKRNQRQPSDCCLVMFDIDHFKKVNDTYGHPAGDEVIRRTAETLRNNLRDVDIAGRYGGEEFAIILINADEDGAGIFAERLRANIESLEVFYDGTQIPYTISLGISQLNEKINSPGGWIEAADSALYEAKHAGRNCWKVNKP
ncbi:sensor domain-containing diguanylate cyclase [Aurantivibrio plasticivorans]